jgi:hypothetical protein
MMQSVLRSPPRLADVAREQLRAVGLALRLPAVAAAAVVAVATPLVTANVLRDGTVIDFHPERWIIPGIAGLLLPIGVWKGEARFGAGFLWTLPADRRGHALAKAGAGWVWLMAAVAFFVLWLLAVTLLSGGNVLGEEALLAVPQSAVLNPAGIDPALVRTLRWMPEPLLWLVPFTAATAMYLLSSALALGTRHPVRWIVGCGAGVFVLAAVFSELGFATDTRWLVMAPSRLVGSIFYGRYGLETVLIASTESLKVETTYLTGERTIVWVGLPDVGQWAIATLLWTGAGLLALWAAANRHRENRRR